MANLITLSRIPLLVLVIWIAYRSPSAWQLVNVPLVLILFIADAVDGMVARHRDKTSLLGAILDIAADRMVEYSLWIVLADLNHVPIWVPLLFVIRGSLVDTIRTQAEQDVVPFAMTRSKVGRFLVGNRVMRGFYGTVKAVTFCWLLLIHPMPELRPALWAEWSSLLVGIGNVLIWTSVTLCVLRAVPVVIDFVRSQRRGRRANASSP